MTKQQAQTAIVMSARVTVLLLLLKVMGYGSWYLAFSPLVLVLGLLGTGWVVVTGVTFVIAMVENRNQHRKRDSSPVAVDRDQQRDDAS